jgi:hypothetical protein
MRVVLDERIQIISVNADDARILASDFDGRELLFLDPASHRLQADLKNDSDVGRGKVGWPDIGEFLFVWGFARHVLSPLMKVNGNKKKRLFRRTASDLRNLREVSIITSEPIV